MRIQNSQSQSYLMFRYKVNYKDVKTEITASAVQTLNVFQRALCQRCGPFSGGEILSK
jgi:hypothetical protein